MATNIIYRATTSATTPVSTTAKLSPLTNIEVDGNFKSLVDSVDAKAPLASPTLTGTPISTTPSQFDNTTKIATTAYVNTLGVHSNGYASYAVTTTLPVTAFGKTNFYNSSSVGTFTLPSPVAGGIVMISNIGTGVLTVTTPAAQIIYYIGSTTATSFILNSGESVVLSSDGGSYISSAVTQNISSLLNNLPLPIANGGTGGTTGIASLIALGERTSATGSVVVSAGTTAQRDASPVFGYQRANNSTNSMEWWNGTAWVGLGGASGSNGNGVMYENDNTVTGNYTITTNRNAMTAGPITINTGVTVTIPTGSTWTIV